MIYTDSAKRGQVVLRDVTYHIRRAPWRIEYKLLGSSPRKQFQRAAPTIYKCFNLE